MTASKNDLAPDIAAIANELRGEIERQRNELLPYQKAFADDAALAADLATLHTDSDIYNVWFTSHRPWLGRFIILGKRIIREFISSILVRQVTYNSTNARVVTQLVSRLDIAAQQIERLNELVHQLERLMLRCSEIEQELRSIRESGAGTSPANGESQ